MFYSPVEHDLHPDTDSQYAASRGKTAFDDLVCTH
jgi:hypothetical protein